VCGSTTLQKAGAASRARGRLLRRRCKAIGGLLSKQNLCLSLPCSVREISSVTPRFVSNYMSGWLPGQGDPYIPDRGQAKNCSHGITGRRSGLPPHFHDDACAIRTILKSRCRYADNTSISSSMCLISFGERATFRSATDAPSHLHR
jgi:hypothetical protein